ncbi:thiamine biosynthesis protein ThiF [Campylobacter geochelonis]|uniref:Thiamine biosynthesis protein ThiF n=2 Tax=Campylobacter geochelonis TaxID=1780362 RepID=A0A128EFB1_9BACT|nr:ThiS adenylyltransferase [Campylobacter geochelonis]CZE47614.1 thiamine biosynthesis protein ThiF [Campylobacter geochelonis]CZE48535.1 thiamine biosynthesis protein ThiF [Campylobacter geochelonis]CZE51160.1 thiamine biosynthesis protein ThiF [Campylobacter geochelonis]
MLNLEKQLKQTDLNSRNPKDVNQAVKNARVAILGLGGLGSNIAVMLARVGVANLLLIDFDTIEASNLNRQIYTTEDIGKLKTQALKEHILKINPFVNATTLNLVLNRQNLDEILKDESIICEAFDKADTKAMIAEFASKNLDKTFVMGSGMSGYESSNLVKTTKFGLNIYICGDKKSDMSIGIMAPRVMMCAAHQANMILRIIMKEFKA